MSEATELARIATVRAGQLFGVPSVYDGVLKAQEDTAAGGALHLISAPVVSGTSQEGEELTTSNGVWGNWAGTTIPTFTYQWEAVPDQTTDEVQVITVTATGGTFTLTYGAETTGAIAYNASAATVKTALVALTAITTDDIAVTGSAGGPYTITVQDYDASALKNLNISQITGNGASLTRLGTVTIVEEVKGTGSVNEQQSVTLDAASGTFTLTYGGDTTDPIAYNASAGTVETALLALASLTPDKCSVTGSAGGPYTVEFIGALVLTDVNAITSSAASLVRAGLAVGTTSTQGGTATGTAITDISAATDNTYTLTSGEIGKRVRCKVTATNDEEVETATSTASDKVISA